MAKILIVGSVNMDLVVRVPHSPKPGETVLGGDFETFPGGKGANQAVAAARMGGEVTMVGRVGNDNFGDTLIQGMVNDNIKTTYLVKDSEAPTGIAMIAVAADGENMIVVASGANYQVSPDDVNNARDIMRDTDLLLLQLECPMEAVTAAVDLAQAYDVPVVLNPAPAQPLSQHLLSNINALTPNEEELLMLTGEKEISKAIRKSMDWGVKNLVITLGANGVRVITDRIDKHIPAHEITAVDTTAAGDAFNGAFAVMLAEGKSLLEAVNYGMAAGALSATKRGAQPSLPTREAVETLMQSSSQ
jgi:ribokinase